MPRPGKLARPPRDRRSARWYPVFDLCSHFLPAFCARCALAPRAMTSVISWVMRRLTDAVILERQVIQQLLGVLVGGVHGGHARVLLAAEAVDKRAVNKARDIAVHDVIQYRRDATAINSNGRGRPSAACPAAVKIAAVQAAAAACTGRLGGQAAFHIRIDDDRSPPALRRRNPASSMRRRSPWPGRMVGFWAV